ncbi:MAG TPA: methylmalonyl Co-A mutase-associated GTPase MeaB [Bacteroidales bacterium]|nr:methylmalonyl Co-A mutase-associated GTPase MeaB [Bacteroidales bacterium]
MLEEDKFKSALNVQKGITQPPAVNPQFLNKAGKTRKKKYSAGEYVNGILSGNRTILSQAITLLESSNAHHFDTAQEVIEECLHHGTGSIRIGITGVPGAGKSTFIESFGKLLTGSGRKVAVLAIDPSSTRTRGSILGDKTRMESLGVDPNAFIRPSPAAGTLGGVARKTRETIILCEAAGFDTIIVETVGVGQSETAVSSMVDFFLLIMLAGAGDELQGMKRGIMEMADLIAINKADGDNKIRAEKAAIEFRNALHLFPHSSSGWSPRVMTCSALERLCIDNVWGMISEYVSMTRASGYFEERRKEQAIMRMHDTILEQLKNSFYNNEEIKRMSASLESQLREGLITSYKAAWDMLNKYFKRCP